MSKWCFNYDSGEYEDIDKDGYISLTNEGTALAEDLFERHTVLTKFLEIIGVSEEIASEDACRIEHIISQESFNAMKKHLEKFHS